jgi:hypothetical protein
LEGDAKECVWDERLVGKVLSYGPNTEGDFGEEGTNAEREGTCVRIVAILVYGKILPVLETRLTNSKQTISGYTKER